MSMYSFIGFMAIIIFATILACGYAILKKIDEIYEKMYYYFQECARRYAQWGAEHLADTGRTSPNDLEEAAKKCNSNLQLQEYFIKGGIWQKERMMKEAVERIGKICKQEEIDPAIARVIADHWWEML